MSVVRVVLGYVVLFCLVLAGTWLVMLGFAFLPALIMRDWQNAAIRAGSLASGILVWVIAMIVERKIRRKRTAASEGKG